MVKHSQSQSPPLYYIYQQGTDLVLWGSVVFGNVKYCVNLKAKPLEGSKLIIGPFS